MSEIKKEIKPNADGSYTITDAHSTADIVRWLLTQDSKETILYLLNETLAQPEQEPVGEVINERGDVDWISFVPSVGSNLYTTLPQRTWVGLTDDEVKKIAYNTAERKVAKDIEAKLRSKNHE